MRRLIIAAVLLLISVAAYSQAQITTKKEKFSDFKTKTLKVVMTDNIFLSEGLRNAAKNSWTISPYDICTLEEFENLKSNPDYYFLIAVDSKRKKEETAGLMVLSILKGGTGETLNDMLEAVSIPICSAEDPSGRELTFLPAIISILQNYMTDALSNGFKEISNTKSLKSATKMELIFTTDDLSSQVKDLKAEGVRVVDEDEQSEFVEDAWADCLVSYVVAPTDPSKGSMCYKMIIDARSHELYYYRRHKITPATGAGFLKSDIAAVTAGR